VNSKKAKALRHMSYRGNETNNRVYVTNSDTGQIRNDGLRNIYTNAKDIFNDLNKVDKHYRNRSNNKKD
jgi:hypothetical protein